MTPHEYLQRLQARFRTGISTEHSYRGDLQTLLETLAPGAQVTNEPSRVACGAPDYIITRKGIPVGYIEAKDLGADLDNKSYREQFDRYRGSLNNLIITNYLEFRLFRNGNPVAGVTIGGIAGNRLTPLPDQFEAFLALAGDFCTYGGITIRSAEKLSKLMAGKARMLALVIRQALESDEAQPGNTVYEAANTSLREQLAAFREILIHDIKANEFADIYAQTVTYGMFAARLNDPSLDSFSRAEAAELIPRTNPFLRKLFQYVAGYDLDDRIRWIVDDLADIFRAVNVADLLKDFGKSTGQTDPVIHFYETFLGEYDPKLRKARGVWYTPQPVVNFIVRAVDDILKSEFGLPQGLADTSKIKIRQKVATKATDDQRSKVKEVEVEQEVHRVQILDPAAGTGTFLAEVIRQIYRKFEGQEGIWSRYVDDHLIPRLNGFELLMASYAMAHLKLDMLLRETGYTPTREQRFRVFLTNSLEEHHPHTGTLFANWISAEANEANFVKRDTPVMVIIGNPPYSVSSINKSIWIDQLMIEYKEGLSERNIQPLSDDYIKFIRYGQYLVDKNGDGILGYISNSSFLNGIIHRQMRKELLKTFDKIYIVDLHGNAKKREISPDGTIDQNVFDIMQGVSINIFIKKRRTRSNTLSKVYHYNLYGSRKDKYEFLSQRAIAKIEWETITPEEPSYIFGVQMSNLNEAYADGFGINQIWMKFNTGVETGKDEFFISENKQELLRRFKTDIQSLVIDYNIKDNIGFKLSSNLKRSAFSESHIQKYLFKPFDIRFCYYDSTLLRRASYGIQKEFIGTKNLAIICKRGRLLGNNDSFAHISITNMVTDKNILADQSYLFPLYLYPNDHEQETIVQCEDRQPNLNEEIVKKISDSIGVSFTPEKRVDRSTFSPVDILDYINAVLHSPAYRKKYKEFLKIDFPRVPYPKDAETFWKLVALGSELRQLHLLESPKVDQFITSYPVEGSNEVGKVQYKDGNVMINERQYFANVPEVAWNFYIGGYQPAQKWLKDRKGRVLTFEDIMHYQKIIVALAETGRLMQEIDETEFIK